jgi:hypothetical protein
MKNISLWPYEECKFVFDKKALEFKISTPWQKATFSVASTKASQFEQLISSLEMPPTAGSLAFMSKILSPFSNHPFFYFLPRPLQKDLVLKNDSSLSSVDQESWDAELALQLSRIDNDNYDAVSLLTVLRRYYLLELLEKISDQQVLRLISKGTDGEKSKRALALLVRQNHFVTASCEDMLTPALERHPSSAEKIRDFIAAERGHDKILAHALKSMNVNPENEKVLRSTKDLTEFFKAQATEDILTFAFMVDIFERSSSGEHPLARVLREKGFEAAAKAIQNHANINIEEEHHNEGLEIIEELGGISEVRGRRLVNKAYEAAKLVIAMLEERFQEITKILS